MEELDRGYDAVISKMAHLGLERRRLVRSAAAKRTWSNSRKWSAEEESRLIELYDCGASIKDIAMDLGKGRDNVSAKITRLGLKRRSVWSNEEESKLAEMYIAGAGIEEIADAINRSHDAVIARARHLRVRRKKPKTANKSKLTCRQRRHLSERYMQLLRECSLSDGSIGFLKSEYGIHDNQSLIDIAKEFFSEDEIRGQVKEAKRYAMRRRKNAK
jgi:transposase-like protein